VIGAIAGDIIGSRFEGHSAPSAGFELIRIAASPMTRCAAWQSPRRSCAELTSPPRRALSCADILMQAMAACSDQNVCCPLRHRSEKYIGVRGCHSTCCKSPPLGAARPLTR